MVVISMKTLLNDVLDYYIELGASMGVVAIAVGLITAIPIGIIAMTIDAAIWWASMWTACGLLLIVVTLIAQEIKIKVNN